MARKGKGRKEDLWEDDYFLDISSNSGPPPRPVPNSHRPAPQSRPSRQPGSTRRPPAPVGRTGPTRPPRPRGRPSGGPEARRSPPPSSRSKQGPRRRSGKKMGNGTRRLLLAATILVMAVVTALLCIFLLFKVSDIQITGDKVYQDSEILSRCDYQIGDNLVFLTTGDREEKLKEELPYIENVEIRRHIPGTLEIHITGAQVVSCVSGGNSWLYISKGNKILEQKDVPRDGVLQVTGLASLNTAPGQPLKTEDEAVLAAYEAVLAKLVELDAAAKFTKLDLTDLYDIRLTYEDRVVFKLGGAAELDYKIQFGFDIVSDPEKIGSQEKGELDLSDAADVKKASFTAGTSSGSASSQASSAPESGTASSQPESGRDGEIPDELYTGDSGGSPDEGGTEDAGNTGTADGEWDEGGTDAAWDAGEPDPGDTGDWTGDGDEIDGGGGTGTDDGGTQ